MKYRWRACRGDILPRFCRKANVSDLGLVRTVKKHASTLWRKCLVAEALSLVSAGLHFFEKKANGFDVPFIVRCSEASALKSEASQTSARKFRFCFGFLAFLAASIYLIKSHVFVTVSINLWNVCDELRRSNVMKSDSHRRDCGYFMAFFLCDGNLIINPSQIDLWKNLSASREIPNLRH